MIYVFYILEVPFMSKNNNSHSIFGGCLPFLLGFSIVFIATSYLDTEPKNRIKEDIIKKGDEFSIDNKDLSNYINVLEDLNLNYTTSKDGNKTTVKINRSNK